MSLTVLSLFSGIGAFEKALSNLKIPYKTVAYCEVDKYASKAYSIIHKIGEDKNLGDITKIPPHWTNVDLITYGFPCQDISIAGSQSGLNKMGKKTNSGLVWDALRIINESQPKYAVCENVKNLVGNKFKNEFNAILAELSNSGYNNYWKILNAKNFGIPQNRERVFIVSIRKELDNGIFQFPDNLELKIKMEALLEDCFDKKYILEKEVEYSPLESYQVRQIANVLPTRTRDNPNQGRVYDPKGLCPTLTTTGGGGRQPMIPVLCGNKYFVRKLLPIEYFRFMGFEDNDCKTLIKNKFSDTQLYKMAGNSIVVNVIQAILKQLLKGELKNENS